MSNQGFVVAQGNSLDIGSVSESSAQTWLRFLGGRVGGKYLEAAVEAAKKDGYDLVSVDVVNRDLKVRNLR